MRDDRRHALRVPVLETSVRVVGEENTELSSAQVLDLSNPI
jgi:hypothetical protein